jgi:hydrogenase maturation factor
MFTRAVLLLTFGLVPVLAQGHHSFASEFTRETVTIEGVVTEVWFKNPHIRYYVEITTPSGAVEIWDTRGGSATNLQRDGKWTADSIKVGDHVVMTGNRGRDGRKLLDIRTVRLLDGTVLPPDGVEEYRHTR